MLVNSCQNGTRGNKRNCFADAKQALGLVVSEKKIFFIFPHYKPMVENVSPGHDKFGPQGHGWQDLSRVPLHIATY